MGAGGGGGDALFICMRCPALLEAFADPVQRAAEGAPDEELVCEAGGGGGGGGLGGVRGVGVHLGGPRRDWRL